MRCVGIPQRHRSQGRMHQGMTRRILGIDYDTYQITVVELDLDDHAYFASFVAGDPTKRSASTKKIEVKKADERFYDLHRAFDLLVRTRHGGQGAGDIVFAYVEEPVAVPAGVNTTIRQSAVWGAIRLVLRQWNIRCVSVNVSTWKKEALLNGHATKDEIKDWAVAVFGLSKDLTQDVYDAAAIAAAARKVMS